VLLIVAVSLHQKVLKGCAVNLRHRHARPEGDASHFLVEPIRQSDNRYLNCLFCHVHLTSAAFIWLAQA
jgi:hypothetical protein